MEKRHKEQPIFSGASPEQVAEDLRILIDFQQEGISLQALQQLMEERLFPHLMNYDLPSFQSMFNVIPEEGARLGAAAALRYNQGVTNWQVSPGAATLEELCCKALCRLFSLGPESEATPMYCGTYANQHAVYLALHKKAETEGFDFNEKGIQGFKDPDGLAVLTSEDAHFSLKHAVRTLGLGEKGLITVKVDKNRRMDIEDLEKKLGGSDGNKQIFCVVATAGTTSCGSVDPLLPIAQACQASDVWLHVDGAYGFAYSLVPEWEHYYAGRELADSVSWDPHKQMGVPIPNSVLFLKRKEDFRRMSIFGDYFNLEGDPRPNPGIKSPPTTRPFSALPIVTSIRHQGLNGLVERLRAPLEAIREAARRIEDEPGVELSLYPDTGILCFRVIPDDFQADSLDELQGHIYDRILNEGTRTVSKTRLGEDTVLRLVAISPSLTADDLMETVGHSRWIAGEYIRSSNEDIEEP